MDQALLTALAAVAGFIAKSLWDLYWKRRGELERVARQKRIDFLERQLSLFYWPLYLQLQKNNVIWDHIVNKKDADVAIRRVITAQLFHSFLLPHHEDTLRLIESNIYLAQPDEELEDLLLRFIRHVTIFKALTDVGLRSVFPMDVGEPWPEELFLAVERRLRFLQQQFDRETRRENIDEGAPVNANLAQRLRSRKRPDDADRPDHPAASQDWGHQRPTRAVERSDTAQSTRGPAAHR